MSKTLLTSEVLDLAADAIQMAGWGVGPATWDMDNGRGLCIEGAIAAVIDVPRFAGVPNDRILRACPAYKAMQEYLFGQQSPVLYYWNDAFAESQEQVIEVLRAAAAVERVKEHATLQQSLDADKTIASGDAATALRGYETEDQPLPLDEKAVA